MERVSGYFIKEARQLCSIAHLLGYRQAFVCVYCNHCQPCPMGLNVGLMNKYYDLAKAGDALAHNHYGKLGVKADKCVQCGHCNSHCPFHVDQMARMQEINMYFNKV